MMLSKLATLWWFIKNPRYFSHVPQLFAQRRNSHLENTREESTKWCEGICVDQPTALKQLTGDGNLIQLSDQFPEIMNAARKAQEACPFPMGGEGAVSLLYTLTATRDVTRILETGVAYGWSSLAFLLALRDRDGAKLISNDMPYAKMGNDQYVGCVVPEDLRDKWELQRYPDIKGIPLALDKLPQLDIVHYDSDKSYCGRDWATPLVWQALAPGGLFISDDINDNLAFKHFCEKQALSPIVFPHEEKYVGVLTKPT